MVKKWNITIPQLSGDQTRRAYIWLPASYEKEPDRRYPVMYMFDGHNVFFDSDATFGKSWGMGKYMAQSKKDLIIVAVECNHEGNGRLQEYSPVTFHNATLGRIKGKGRVYMKWLIHELKPYIDANYRTLPDRMNTIIAGSSMGGLMALYGCCVFNHVFQRAACLSPSLWVDPGKVIELVARAHIKNDTCIYMDYGSEEMQRHSANREALSSTVRMLLMKNVNLTFRVVPGGVHTEACWAEQVPYFMECLGIE